MVSNFITLENFDLENLQVGSNISEDQLTAIAERAIVEAKQNLDGPQEVGLGFDDFNRAMKATEIEAKMSVRFHD